MPNRMSGNERGRVRPLRDRQRDVLPDMHSEAWWIRLTEDDLTAQERELWHAHLQECEACRAEWEALAYVDEILRQAPTPPPLSPGFTDETVIKIVRRQRLHRLLTFLVGVVIVAVVSAIILGYTGSVYASVGRRLGAIVSARQMLFQSLVQTFVGVMLAWRTALPFILGGIALAFLLVMPNGLLMTVALVWLTNRQRSMADA
ncbi:MAG: anti-sigma factor family protein [Anaerolineae bacterium]